MNSYQELWNALPPIQLHFFCKVCERRYVKGWLQSEPTLCLFCRTYREIENPSRSDLLYDIEWVFIQSGLEDKHAFYADYLNQMHRWADSVGIPYTQKDMWQEQDLRQQIHEIMEGS